MSDQPTCHSCCYSCRYYHRHSGGIEGTTWECTLTWATGKKPVNLRKVGPDANICDCFENYRDYYTNYGKGAIS